MKISGPRAPSAAVQGSGSRPASEGFAVATPDPAEGPAIARPSMAAALSGVDALMALQGADLPVDRRRRAVRRGTRLLDVLDQVKLALLSGETGAQALSQLAAAVRDERERLDDPLLEGVLDEIDTRAAVELAKAEMSRIAA